MGLMRLITIRYLCHVMHIATTCMLCLCLCLSLSLSLSILENARKKPQTSRISEIFPFILILIAVLIDQSQVTIEQFTF
jgi:hypothetical protein